MYRENPLLRCAPHPLQPQRPSGRGGQGRGGQGDLSGSATPGSSLDPPLLAPAPSFALSGAGRAAGGAGPANLECAPPGALPSLRPPRRGALPVAPRAGTVPGRARGVGGCWRGARGDGGERGGREPGAARPARRPAPRCRASINGARSGGGGIWRAGRQLEAHQGRQRRGDSGVGVRGRRPPQSEVRGSRGKGGAPQAGTRAGPRGSVPSARSPGPAPAAERLFTFDRVFPARGRCPGRLPAGDYARRPALLVLRYPHPGSTRRAAGDSGGRGVSRRAHKRPFVPR